jgi:soluble lytic murein transglycosylase-like protein
METRHHDALIRTFKRLGRFFFARSLIVILFVPFLFVLSNVLQQQVDEISHAVAEQQHSQPVAAAVQRPSKELVQIHSIITSNRPYIGDQEAWLLTQVIYDECAKHKVDPILVLALIDVESKFQYAAVSPKGARGLMQILPYVGEWLLHEIGLERHATWNKFQPEFLDDPILNIRLGVYYLKDLKRTFRDRRLALTAYNLGPTETRNRLDNDIEFSDRYARAVLSTYQKYKRLQPPLF